MTKVSTSQKASKTTSINMLSVVSENNGEKLTVEKEGTDYTISIETSYGDAVYTKLGQEEWDKFKTLINNL